MPLKISLGAYSVHKKYCVLLCIWETKVPVSFCISMHGENVHLGSYWVGRCGENSTNV